MDSVWAEHLVNVVDVEATCWAGSPPPGAVSEIIEIGLTVVDLDAGERVARHRILVRPVRSTVSEFCTELTGLTPHEVGQGSASPRRAGCWRPSTTRAPGRGSAGATTTATSSPGSAGPLVRPTPSAANTPTPRRSSPRRTGCESDPAWHRPWRSPGGGSKGVTTGARTTPGTSRRSCSTCRNGAPGRPRSNTPLDAPIRAGGTKARQVFRPRYAARCHPCAARENRRGPGRSAGRFVRGSAVRVGRSRSTRRRSVRRG